MITAERLQEIRRLAESSVPYPSAEWEATHAALAAAVPELVETIDELLVAVRSIAEVAKAES